MTWSVESIQFAKFVQPDTGRDDAFKTWLEIFQSSPESYNKIPGVPPHQPPGSRAGGNLGGYSFAIQHTPGRIDLVLEGGGDDGEFPIVKNDGAALSLFKDFAEKLAGSGDCLRLGWVVNLFRNFPNLQSANAYVIDQVGLKDMPPEAQDINFAVNLRASFEPAPNTKVELNRLCRWASAQKQLMQVQFISSIGGQPVRKIREQPAVTLQIDINTVPKENSSIRAKVAAALVDVMSGEALQIRENGYAYLSNRR